MSLEFKEREVLARVQVCACDRCGQECPPLTNKGGKSGASAFHSASLSVRKNIEGGHSKWAIGGGDQPGSSTKGHEQSNPTLCLDCLNSLIHWLSRTETQ